MSKILTVQYVRIEQTAASISDRLLAQIIDWIVMLAYVTLMVLITSGFNINSFWFIILAILFPIFFYTLFCELFFGGQSLGKMAMKTRVVKADGSTPTLGDYVLRWLLYIVDGPMTSFMGVLVMLITKRTQRLGDLAAGTMVIKLQGYRKTQVNLDDYDYAQPGYKPRYPQAEDLSEEQVQTIIRTLQTSRNGDASVVRLADKVQEKFGVTKTEATDGDFLRRVVRDYRHYALEEI